MALKFDFGTSAAKSNTGFGGSTYGAANSGKVTIGQPGNTSIFNPNVAASSQAQIDITHLRPTTRFDQLTPDLQKDIEFLDNAILNQIKQASEVSVLLPAVVAAGQTLQPGVDFVKQKLDDLETSLENDAEAIVSIRDRDLNKAEGEGKCVFRTVDRMKVPRQYQVGHTQNESISGGVYGGSGLSGWWNHPEVLKGSVRTGGNHGQTMQLPTQESEDNSSGPKSLIELFNVRIEDMTELTNENKELLAQVEGYMNGLELKVRSKERDFTERLTYGSRNGGSVMNERDHQMELLKYVFGEVQRNLYEVADKIGGCRDGMIELGLGR